MNKINEATFFIQVWKKDRWGAFETDEGGPEKHFCYLALPKPLSCFFLIQSPYFASMFSGSWKESSMKKVEMDIVDENIDEDCKYSHFCIEKQIQ